MPCRALVLLVTLAAAGAPLPLRAEPAQALLLCAQRLLSTLPTISGRVSTVDGSPVAGALVMLHLDREMSPDDLLREMRRGAPVREVIRVDEAETDRQGRFLLVEAGAHDLEVTAPGFLRARVEGLAAAPGRPVAGLTVRLVRGAVLLGRVLDEAGAPVAGARVELAGGDSFTAGTLSDPEGRYRLDGIDPGEREVRIRAAGDDLSLPRVRIAPGENRLDLPFVRRAVRGRVLTPEGEPVAEARVRLSCSGARQSSTTGADGAFAFRVVEGWCRLDVEADGFALFRTRPLRIGGAAAREIEVRLDRAGTVSGRIRGLSGEERSEIRVTAFRSRRQGSAPGGRPTGERTVLRVNARDREPEPTAVADDQGRYRLVGLGAGTWQVIAEAGFRSTAGEVTLEAGAAEARLDLTFPAAWPVRGRVVDRDGTPVAGAFVFLHGGDDQQGTAESGTDGAFSLQLPDGTYEVVAEQDGYAPTVSTEPVTVAGAAVGGVEVRLADRTRLTGRILGLTPAELAESSVSAVGNENYASRPGQLDDHDGSYAIEDLGPGDWIVSAYHAGESAVARLHVAPGELRSTLDLTFVRGHLTLRGRLRGGDPLADYVAVLVDEREENSPLRPPIVVIGDANLPENGAWRSSPDDQGVFQFPQLRPGRYRLEVVDAHLDSIGGDPVYRRGIELTEDCELEIELPAEPEAGAGAAP